MSTGDARLGIDYGGSITRAVLAWPDGSYLPVLIDGTPLLPSAVHVGADGQIRTGTAAWQHAATAPDGFVPAVKQYIHDGHLTLGTDTVAVLDLVAATLRRVAEAATGIAGAPIVEVRMVVPAGWGPRRRTLLRQAAHRAGLPEPTLVETPVAVAEHLLATGITIPPGACVAVADFGAGFEASIIRRTPTGFDVLATIDAPDAGGRRLDTAIAEHLTTLAHTATGRPPPPAAAPLPAPYPRTLLDSARQAKESLTHSSTVLVPMPPPQLPVVLTTTHLADLTRAVLQPAAHATRQAIAAAEIPLDQLADIYCVGGGAHLPEAAALLGEDLHLAPVVVPDPQYAAVLGAAGATTSATTPAAAPPPPSAPPIRRAVGILIPGLASIALLTHAYLTARYDPGPDPRYAYVRANWGEVTMAAVFALLAALTAATLIAATLPPPTPTSAPSPPLSVAGARIGTGLLAATALGLATAGLYAVTGATYFALPTGPFLRWALLPLLPIAVTVAAVALLTTRPHASPAAGWDAWLAFPPSSVLCATTGMLMIQFWVTTPTDPTQALLATGIGHGGGLLLGIGTALALARSTPVRIITAAPLAIFTALIAAYPTTGILAITYTTAVTVWWSRRLLHLLRR